MSTRIEEISTITAKGQTTVPKAVRQILGLDHGGRIAFRVDEHGVTVSRADAEENDPALDSFLAFLAADIEKRPAAVAELSSERAERARALTQGMAFDPNAPIEGDIDL